MDIKKIKELLNNEYIILILILLFSCFLYTWKIGKIVFVDEDEAVYAQVASEMIDSGNWIDPHVNFKVFHEKPPLTYWLIAISFLLFGKNEFAVRFWHSLIALGGIYVLYLIAKNLFDKPVALFSSAIFSTFLFYFYQARSPLMDIPLSFFITLSFYFFIRYVKSSKVIFYYLYWVSMGFAVMTKGLVGIILPFATIVIFIILTKRFQLFNIHLLGGFMAFILVAAPWHIIEFYKYGWPFIDKIFVHHSVIHYLKGLNQTNEPNPFFSHFISITYGCLPWSGFLICGILLFLKDEDPSGRKYFIFSWILVVFLFFSITSQKRIRYILPLFPALSIIIAYLWSSYFSGKNLKKYMNLSAVFSFPIGLLILGGIIYAKMKFADDFNRFAPFCLLPLLILSIGIILSSGIILITNKKNLSFMSFIITALFCYTMLINSSGEYFNQARPVKIFSGIINNSAGDKKIGCFIDFYHSMVFYTNHKVEEIKDRNELLLFLKSRERVFCLADRKDLNPDEFRQIYKISIFILDEKSGYLLLSNKKE